MRSQAGVEVTHHPLSHERFYGRLQSTLAASAKASEANDRSPLLLGPLDVSRVVAYDIFTNGFVSDPISRGPQAWRIVHVSVSALQ